MNRLLFFVAFLGVAAIATGACSDSPSADPANRPPQIEPLQSVSVLEGERVVLTPSITDPDSSEVVVAYSGWMTTPTRLATHADIGSHLVTVTANDGSGGVATADVEITVNADANSNSAPFSMQPATPGEGPFPNDAFTVADTDMLTGRRVRLPLDLMSGSELDDTEAVNRLDGFSLFPRITVPLNGDVPDASSFTSETVFIVGMSAPQRGTQFAIDQRIIDDAHHDAPRLIFAPEVFLAESSRYVLVVTKGLTSGGQSLRRADALTRLLWQHESSQSPPDAATARIFDAFDLLTATNAVALDDVLTLAVFTTRTVTDLGAKLRNRLSSDGVGIAAPSFDVDGVPGMELYARSEIQSISRYRHRASSVSDSSSVMTFPPGSLVTDLTGSDWNFEVYAENVRTGARILIPEIDVATDGSGAVGPTDISALSPIAGDKIALLAKWQDIRPLYLRPHLWNSAVGKIAVGRFSAPRYVDATGELPILPTGPDSVMKHSEMETIIFIVAIPEGAKPADGWPLAIYSHGGGGNLADGGFLSGASVLAQHGIATVAFTAPEHGGGPQSSLEIVTAEKTVSVYGIGRNTDLDADGFYADFDDEFGTRRALRVQRLADTFAFVKALQLGADFEGTAAADLTVDPTATYAFGISYGGWLSAVLASFEPGVSLFAANAPPGIGGAFMSSGYQPRMETRRYMDQLLEARTPSLLNGTSPVWGGQFDEAIPLKGMPVQIGMVDGAEEIQRAFDFLLWRDLQGTTSAYGEAISSGVHRGAPANMLVQITRGDGMAPNPGQWFLIQAGRLQEHTSIIRCENEPQYDAYWGSLSIPGWMARHILLGVRHSALLGEPATQISHLAREQIAGFFDNGGVSIPDPDPLGNVFSGDVFEVPISTTTLEAIASDGGF